MLLLMPFSLFKKGEDNTILEINAINYTKAKKEKGKKQGRNFLFVLFLTAVIYDEKELEQNSYYTFSFVYIISLFKSD